MKKTTCYTKFLEYGVGNIVKAVQGYRVNITNDNRNKLAVYIYKNDTFRTWHVVDRLTGMSLGRTCNYDGTHTITVTYTNNCRSIYTVEN